MLLFVLVTLAVVIVVVSGVVAGIVVVVIVVAVTTFAAVVVAVVVVATVLVTVAAGVVIVVAVAVVAVVALYVLGCRSVLHDVFVMLVYVGVGCCVCMFACLWSMDSNRNVTGHTQASKLQFVTEQMVRAVNKTMFTIHFHKMCYSK